MNYPDFIDPIAISIPISGFWGESLNIYWYGIAYVLGAYLIYLHVLSTRHKFNINLSNDLTSDLIFTYGLFLGAVVGGRIGNVIFYDLHLQLDDPFYVFKIWQGGMSFHGALIGIIIGTYLFCKNKNQNIFSYLDVVAVCSPIGIFLGRISNFINSELYGIETNVPWSVKFIKIDDLNRHPSQIYEAIFEGVVLFIILSMMFNRLRNTPGIISGYFLILYSFFRFVIEFFREPDQQLGYLFFNLSMGQIISCIALTCGLIIIYYKNANRTQ